MRKLNCQNWSVLSSNKPMKDFLKTLCAFQFHSFFLVPSLLVLFDLFARFHCPRGLIRSSVRHS